MKQTEYIPIEYLNKYGHTAGDYWQRDKNIEQSYPLCERCDGTGNEHYSTYRACSECDGTGVSEDE